MTDQEKQMEIEKKQKETQERMSNCAKELLAVLHKYDCLLIVQQAVDCNGNLNPAMIVQPIDRSVSQVVKQEELKENGDNQETG